LTMVGKTENPPGRISDCIILSAVNPANLEQLCQWIG